MNDNVNDEFNFERYDEEDGNILLTHFSCFYFMSF